MTFHNVLVLRPGAIGDTLLTFPALRALRWRFPRAEVTVVGNQAPLGLGVAAGILDRRDAFGATWVSDLFGDEPTPSLRTRLERFDLGIVWMHSAEAAGDLAARLERAGIRKAVPLVSFPAPRSGRHLADHLVDTLAPLGISGPRPAITLRHAVDWPHHGASRPLGEEAGARSPQRRGEDTETTETGCGLSDLSSHPPRGLRVSVVNVPLPRAQKLGMLHGEGPPLVVLHPGAGGRHKRWPTERFAALADRFAEIGCAIAITQGPADDDAVATLRSHVRLARPEVLAGRPLDELARILSRASLFVGNDSGITHLAALLDVPTLSIFGPFDPSYWAPIGPHVHVLDAGQTCPHRFDPREGCRQCAVLSSLDLDPVWEAAEFALAAIPRSQSPRSPFASP